MPFGSMTPRRRGRGQSNGPGPQTRSVAGRENTFDVTALGLRPRGAPVATQIMWKRARGQVGVAYLSPIDAAVPKRTPTEGNHRAVAAMLSPFHLPELHDGVRVLPSPLVRPAVPGLPGGRTVTAIGTPAHE